MALDVSRTEASLRCQRGCPEFRGVDKSNSGRLLSIECGLEDENVVPERVEAVRGCVQQCSGITSAEGKKGSPANEARRVLKHPKWALMYAVDLDVPPGGSGGNTEMESFGSFLEMVPFLIKNRVAAAAAVAGRIRVIHITSKKK